MRLGLVIVGQEGVTWEQSCGLADACEEHGLETLYSSDHYLSQLDETGKGAHDAWTLIAASRGRGSSTPGSRASSHSTNGSRVTASTGYPRRIGLVDEVAARLREYVEAGYERLTIIHPFHWDLESVRLIGQRLVPLLGPVTAS